MYCTLSHRKIRGWGHLRLVEQHNDREIDTPAREEGRPMPIEQFAGDGDIVDRTRALLTAKGVPHKLRKNTVLAYEDVYGASPGYWEARYPDGWKNVPVEEIERDPLAVALMSHVTRKYGDKLVSVRLHADEKTPHWHVISVPLVTRLHKQRGRRRKDGVIPPPVEKTTLYASHETERGGSGRRLEIEHDEWAEATSHLGLVRGKRGSDLTEEERRDRRLRDQQASRQGEERARALKEEASRVKVAQRLVEDGAGEFVRLVGEGRTDAGRIVAEARAEADHILTEARSSAEEAKQLAETAAREAGNAIRALAEHDAAMIRDGARTEAERLAKVVEDRERRLEKAERSIAEDRTAVDADRAAVIDQAGVLAGLIERLEPILSVVVKAHEKLKAAPEAVRRFLDPDGRVGETVKTAVPISKQGTDELRKLLRGPPKVAAVSVEEIDVTTLAAARDVLGGRSGK
ncbi:MAG: hypothetical protein K0S56_2028 [Microvirga sp.]|nr:hypothetical protein [Microvirga sp.]